MPLEASELHAFAEAANAAEGLGVPRDHVDWHIGYLQRLAREMYERGLITQEAALLAEAADHLNFKR